MRPYRTPIWMILIITFFGVSGLSAQTQGDLDEQACGQFHKADVSMNETYSHVLKEYAKDEQFIAKLRMAQKAWLVFRDAQLEALFPKSDKQAEYGTVYPMCHCNDLQYLTEERTKQSKLWLDGRPEGDVCSGSVKIAVLGRSSLSPTSGSQRCSDSPRVSRH